MTRDQVPEYVFNFLGGLSPFGEVERRSEAIDSGQGHRIHYWLNDRSLVANLGRPIPGPVADLIDVAAAIYISDRLALREVVQDSRCPDDRWHRRIHIVIPVRSPETWQRPEVDACLQELLAFLSDDLWSFEFVSRSVASRRAEAQRPLLKEESANRTVTTLFSGGLDSLCGLVEFATNSIHSTVVPVTVVSNTPTRQNSSALAIRELRRVLPSAGHQVLPVRVHVGISGIGRPRNDKEPTQRARAMLFLAAGVAVASISGESYLNVCESGVGAISLPMASDHWGARATRAMHPKSLVLMSRLSALVLDQPILIDNTALFVTKGELVKRLEEARLLEPARFTVSCDRAAYLGGLDACGKCSSCILRRVSLISAGVEELVDGGTKRYRVDWLKPGTGWTRESIVHLVAMRDQVERLREATGSGKGYAHLDSAFPELFDVVSLASDLGFHKNDIERHLMRLYATYVEEFDGFIAMIDRPGWGRKPTFTELFRAADQAAG